MLLVHKCTHEINPTGKFPKGKRVRFTSEASIWKCFVRLRQKRSNIYTARTTNFIFWIQLEKQPLSQTCGDKHCQSNCQDIQWGSCKIESLQILDLWRLAGMLLVHKCTHEINPTGKFPKGKRVRFTSEASIWKCFVRLRQKRSNIYTARTTNFIFWIQLEKQPPSQTCGDKHCQSNCQDIQWGSSCP